MFQIKVVALNQIYIFLMQQWFISCAVFGKIDGLYEFHVKYYLHLTSTD
jgi:hypothetical protein